MGRWTNNLKQIMNAIKRYPNGKFVYRSGNSMGRFWQEYYYMTPGKETYGIAISAAKALKRRGYKFKKII